MFGVTDFGLGFPPDELDDVAKRKWHALTAAGQWGADLVICDRELFTQYCRLASRKQKTDEKIDELERLPKSVKRFSDKRRGENKGLEQERDSEIAHSGYCARAWRYTKKPRAKKISSGRH